MAKTVRLAAFTALFVVSVASLFFGRQRIRSLLPDSWTARLDQFRFGYRVDDGIYVPMRDEARLAVSLYLPATFSGRLPTVYIRHPYDRRRWPEGLSGAENFVRQGYAVVVQDIRGKHGSDGDFIPYQHGADDGVDTVEWIVKQPWSNGRVGTWGCSALGELQFVLAKRNHAAHRAMIAIGAGGAVGSALDRYSYFGLFEGGVFQLASGYGWLLANGQRRPTEPPATDHDPARTLSRLPISDLIPPPQAATNSYGRFATTPLNDASWNELDYLTDNDDIAVPAMVINTWGDQTVGETLALAESMRRKSRQQRVIIAPGDHCGYDVWRTRRWGELEVNGSEQPYDEWFLRWFNHWLRDDPDSLNDLPPYLFFQLGEDQWLKANAWPPENATRQKWYLSSRNGANGLRGDGQLSLAASDGLDADVYRYDPTNPVPSRGGPLCCTGNPADVSGPVDQTEVEKRDDVLVFTSEPLAQPLRIAGPLRTQLRFSSDAKDTDVIARLAHVRPDGKSTNIQEGALRLRYRNGFVTPTLLESNQPVDVSVDMRGIGYTIPQGHRLRLQITSSSFPRLERNLNTGGDNARESSGRVAINRVWHSRTAPSFVELWVLPPRE